MKKILVFLIVLAASISITGQKKIVFTHDDAGNRTKRSIDMTVRSASVNDEPVSFSEELSKKTITIYPNPTKGLLSIEIDKYEADLKGDIQIYNLSGALINSHKINERTTQINLHNNPEGVYILRINLNGENSAWKIIKEN